MNSFRNQIEIFQSRIRKVLREALQPTQFEPQSFRAFGPRFGLWFRDPEFLRLSRPPISDTQTNPHASLSELIELSHKQGGVLFQTESGRPKLQFPDVQSRIPYKTVGSDTDYTSDDKEDYLEADRD